ncbi:hypothetical protein A2Z33_00250 [Candidatus Gottesmanbacteria bacterium RBG_16_52_11]|uniref:Uncharacterized protein n=1 Tax=Candidatus Gottesmanbacteria bacterium RBG_16_52_11 TaxID=1798374 RepID=A0A1F5YNQ3_9BACT|nr:MAG: hypothetical protein A2Z33_00250 [Candidatus Gottesmanbacteria bacterium RBG_16_52_11]
MLPVFIMAFNHYEEDPQQDYVPGQFPALPDGLSGGDGPLMVMPGASGLAEVPAASWNRMHREMTTFGFLQDERLYLDGLFKYFRRLGGNLIDLSTPDLFIPVSGLPVPTIVASEQRGRSYEFDDGSTSERLVLRLNHGDGSIITFDYPKSGYYLENGHLKVPPDYDGLSDSPMSLGTFDHYDAGGQAFYNFSPVEVIAAGMQFARRKLAGYDAVWETGSVRPEDIHHITLLPLHRGSLRKDFSHFAATTGAPWGAAVVLKPVV